jgi:hypothetical protein
MRRVLRIDPMRPLALDRFTRADSTTSLGNAESGQAWGTPFIDTGVSGPNTYGISAGRAYVATYGSNPTCVWLAKAVGTALYTVTCDITWATGAFPGVLFGGNGLSPIGSATFYLAQFRSTGLLVFRGDLGSYTVLGTDSFTPTNGQTYRLRVEFAPGSQRVFRDEALVLTLADATYSGQYVGFRAAAAGTGESWDNLRVVRR